MLGIDRKVLRAAWTLLLFATVVFAVYLAARTIMVFVVALLFAYLLTPIVDFAQRRAPTTWPRIAILGIVYVAFVAGLISLLVLLGSKIGEEAGLLAKTLPDRLKNSDPLAGIPFPGFLEPWRAQILDFLRTQISGLDEKVLPILKAAGGHVAEGLGSILTVVLIPILSFFFLKDGREMRNAMVEAAGSQAHVVSGILDDLHDLLAQYIRALVFLALATLLFYTIFLEAVGVPYPVLLAGIAAILEVIPVVGPLTASGVILLVAAFNGFPHMLWIVIFLVVYRIFQDYVLNPYLMSSGVDVPPLLVLFGVLAGEQVAGIPGMFFSVPVIAALRVLLVRQGWFTKTRLPKPHPQHVAPH
jgi:predicted PurR-regulated permease PerM